MYLFMNVGITNKRLGPSRSVKHNRVDIFKYALSSLSVIPFDEVFIYYDFYDDENLKDAKEDINNYIYKEFSNHKVNLFNYRNTKQSEWKQTLLPILALPKKSIMYLCNDDHIFIESNLDTIMSAIDVIENSEEESTMYLSHWPEMLKASQKYNNGEKYNDYFQYHYALNGDSLFILHKNILRKWWFDYNYGDTFMPRSDYPNANVGVHNIKILTPLREQFRHFEGYPHIGISEEQCPQVEIPDGFFNDEIVVTIPTNNIKHSKDIPLFWRKKLKYVDDNLNSEEDRINHILKIANSRPNEPHLVINNELIKEMYNK